MRVEVGTEAHLEPLEYLFEVSDEHRIVGFGVVRRGATPAPGLERDRVVLASGAAIRSCLGPGATPPNGSHQSAELPAARGGPKIVWQSRIGTLGFVPGGELVDGPLAA